MSFSQTGRLSSLAGAGQDLDLSHWLQGYAHIKSNQLRILCCVCITTHPDLIGRCVVEEKNP